MTASEKQLKSKASNLSVRKILAPNRFSLSFKEALAQVSNSMSAEELKAKRDSLLSHLQM